MTGPEPGVVYAEMKRIALIAAAGLVLSGCTGPWSSPPLRQHYQRQQYPVVVRSPIVEAKPPGVHLRALAQFVSPTRLAIATMGSSSCPSVPDELFIPGRHTIVIHLTVGSWVNGEPVARSPGACTADYGPTPMLVAIDPNKVDVQRPLRLRLLYPNSTTPTLRTVAPLKS